MGSGNGGVPEKVGSRVSALPGTEVRSGGKWGDNPFKSRVERLGSWSCWRCLGALGNGLMFVLGFGAGSHSLRGCSPSGGRVCRRWGEGGSPPWGWEFSSSLLEVREDADGDDEGGQGDGVADGVHQVQAVKHLLEEKGCAP